MENKELENFVSGFAEQFDDTEQSEITSATNFKELDEWSSLVGMSVIAFIKTAYDKTVTGKEIRACETVGDLFNLVFSK